MYIALLLLVSGFALFTYKTMYSPADKKNTLTVGVIIGYAPFAMLNNQAEPEGFDIDIANALAQALNKELVIKDMDLSGLLIALQQGSLDCVLTGLSITPARQERIELVHYYGEPTTTFPLVFWQTIPAGVTSINDLLADPNAVICVEPGSTQEAFLMQEYPSLKLIHIHAMSDIVMNLKYGKATAALMDPDIYPTLQQQSPQLIALSIPLPPAYQSNGVGIGINKANASLIKQIRTLITTFKENGTIDGFAQRWFKK